MFLLTISQLLFCVMRADAVSCNASCTAKSTHLVQQRYRFSWFYQPHAAIADTGCAPSTISCCSSARALVDCFTVHIAVHVVPVHTRNAEPIILVAQKEGSVGAGGGGASPN